jgi:carbon storage regulator
MLVLKRRLGERVLIGDEIEIRVTNVGRRSVLLGICAPKEVVIRRGELTSQEMRKLRPMLRTAGGGHNGRGPARARSIVKGQTESHRGRRRVVIDAEPLKEGKRPSEIGRSMLEVALGEAPQEVLEAVARGAAIDNPIRRALMELAREQLAERRTSK